MGYLKDGAWYTEDAMAGGLKTDAYLGTTKADGSTPFGVEAGRYVLYVTTGCPYASRVLMVHKLLGLEKAIKVVRTFPGNGEHSWFFKPVSAWEKQIVQNQSSNPNIDWEREEPVHNATHLYHLYLHGNSRFTGKVTVPLLYDTKLNICVNNESLPLSKMLVTEWKEFQQPKIEHLNLYPEHLREEMDKKIIFLHDNLNTMVYRCHFASTQVAYEDATTQLWKTLDHIDELLSKSDYLVGNQLTFLDLQLFATTIRFDVAYHHRFRLTAKTIRHNYPNIQKHMIRMYNLPGMRDVTDIEGIKSVYYTSVPLRRGAGTTIAATPVDFYLRDSASSDEQQRMRAKL